MARTFPYHRKALIRPKRPCPPDFREVYLQIGWEGIEEHFRTNHLCIRRWVIECGGDELKAARRAVVRAKGPTYLHVNNPQATRRRANSRTRSADAPSA